MIDLKDMSPDDKSLYWRDCYVFDSVNKIPYIVTGYNGSFRVVNVLNRAESGVSNSRFASDFLFHRPRLGWRNVDQYSLYAYSYPGRSNRKALSSQEVVVEFPFYNELSSAYTAISRKFYRSCDNGRPCTDLEKDVRTLCETLEYMGNTAQVRNLQDYYMRNFFSDFFSREDAVEQVLMGRRASAAINPTWAVSITPTLYKKAAAIMYDNKEVGIVTPDEVVFPNTQETLEAAWNRL